LIGQHVVEADVIVYHKFGQTLPINQHNFEVNVVDIGAGVSGSMID
jgi:hypothetical protein